MKLSPPASSSDLEEAREVARRLHEQRRQAERPAAAPPVVVRRPAAPAAPAARLDVMPGRPAAFQAQAPHHGAARPAAPERPQRPAPVAPPAPEPPPLPPTPPPVVVAPPRPTPAPPLQAPPAIEPPPRPAPERPAAPARAPEPPPVAAPPVPGPWDSEPAETPETEAADALSALSDAAGPSDADEAAPVSDEDAIEIEETNTTLEEMVSAAGLPAEEEIVAPPDLEPGEAAADPGAAYEAAPSAPDPFPSTASPFDDASSIESMSEELFDLPPTPSWDEVVENCLMIAHARGAMLIDPGGHVLASNGFWPEPGPEPIATKLVAMMEKTLKDAPTRSVSAPVGAMHLTAWRVPLAEGLITVAFLGDTPLRAEARTPVDAEILRGAP